MKYILLICFAFLLVNCNTKEKEPLVIASENYLNETEMDSFKSKIIRYVGRLPRRGDHTNKFENRFDDHYKELVSLHDLKYYYPDAAADSDTTYFLLTRIAPSLYLKKVAIAGKIVVNDNNEISYFEETFRTFKMEEPILMEKSETMFTDLINKKDLSQYEFVNTIPEEYIEFPDEFTSYDSDIRQWSSTRENPIEELKEEFREQGFGNKEE